jgi:hypothetical protein
MWSVLAELARKRVGGTVHPLRDINDLEDVTTSELVALLPPEPAIALPNWPRGAATTPAPDGEQAAYSELGFA